MGFPLFVSGEARAEGERRDRRGLSPDVRRQLSFEECDLVLQKQLAFLQALELELVLDGINAKAGDDVVEVAVLEVQLVDALPEHFTVGRMYYHGLHPPYRL